MLKISPGFLLAVVSETERLKISTMWGTEIVPFHADPGMNHPT